jgi:hypothetical protein
VVVSSPSTTPAPPAYDALKSPTKYAASLARPPLVCPHAVPHSLCASVPTEGPPPDLWGDHHTARQVEVREQRKGWFAFGPPRVEEVIGEYRLGRTLGAGGIGVVRKGRHVQTGMRVRRAPRKGHHTMHWLIG